MKLIALIVSAFALAICFIADPPQNNHSVSPRTDSIEKIVVPLDIAPIAKNVSEIRPALETRPTLGVIEGYAQKVIASVVIIKQNSAIEVVSQHQRTSLVESEFIGSAGAIVNTNHNSSGPLGPDNPGAIAVVNTLDAVTHSAWRMPADDCPVVLIGLTNQASAA